jgi:hypothetical protein
MPSANVFIAGSHQAYQAIEKRHVETKGEFSHRGVSRLSGEPGLWFPLTWWEERGSRRPAFAHRPLTDADLREIYPKKDGPPVQTDDPITPVETGDFG